MASFVVKQMVEDESAIDDLTESFTHEPTGINITFKSFDNSLFQKAHNRIAGREHLDLQELKQLPKDEHFFDGLENDKGNTGALMIDAVGRFLVADWDIKNESGEKLPVSGANFKLLIANIPKRDQVSFLQWCMDRAGDVAINNARTLIDTKKKSSSASDGKKTSKT